MMPEPLQWLSPQSEYNWLIQPLLLLVAALAADLLMRRVLAHIQKRATATKTLWDDAILSALKPALSLLIWTVALSQSAVVAATYWKEISTQMIGPARQVGVIVAVAVFFIRVAKNWERATLEENRLELKRLGGPVDEATVASVSKLIRVTVLIITALSLLQSLGFTVSGILAFGGIGGIAVGFAAKDLLSNLFGGLMIYLDRPFFIGEYIVVGDLGVEGTVEHISWRLTRLRTLERRAVYVPNAIFSNVAVTNNSRMTHRRLRFSLGLRYDDAAQVEAVAADIQALLESQPLVDKELPVVVNLEAFGPSTLDLLVNAYFNLLDWKEFLKLQQTLLLEMLAIVERHGAGVAFPTQTLHLAGEPQAKAAGKSGSKPVAANTKQAAQKLAPANPAAKSAAKPPQAND